ncbi:MAG: efflux RND transporter periplasmic adaptor subunit [bacterium]
MNKKKIITSITLVAITFIVVTKISNKKAAVQQVATKQTIKVSTKSFADSKTLLQKNQYPATVVGDQEIKITAKSGGNITTAPGNIGDRVNIGTLLAKIDDVSTIDAVSYDLKSLQVQQSQIAVEQAKKSYSLAKDNYDNIKKTSSSTTAQKDAAKSQRDIAKLQYENATLGLNGTVDNHLITSPISGVITNKAVSLGDSVSVGQLIATISKSTNVKVQFYVDEQNLKTITRGQKIIATDSNKQETILIVRNISAVADQATKKFLIEAYPEKLPSTLLSGTIVSVSSETKMESKDSNNILLPLSAISIGQNESYIFTVENNIAKKNIVTVVKVNGENAEISSDISQQAQIIIDGNKLISDGEKIEIQ